MPVDEEMIKEIGAGGNAEPREALDKIIDISYDNGLDLIMRGLSLIMDGIGYLTEEFEKLMNDVEHLKAQRSFFRTAPMHEVKEEDYSISSSKE